MSKERMVLRMVSRDKYARIVEVLEREIPATAHAVTLYLRREPFKYTVANAMLMGGTLTIERKESK